MKQNSKPQPNEPAEDPVMSIRVKVSEAVNRRLKAALIAKDETIEQFFTQAAEAYASEVLK